MCPMHTKRMAHAERNMAIKQSVCWLQSVSKTLCPPPMSSAPSLNKHLLCSVLLFQPCPFVLVYHPCFLVLLWVWAPLLFHLLPLAPVVHQCHRCQRCPTLLVHPLPECQACPTCSTALSVLLACRTCLVLLCLLCPLCLHQTCGCLCLCLWVSDPLCLTWVASVLRSCVLPAFLLDLQA